MLLIIKIILYKAILNFVGICQMIDIFMDPSISETIILILELLFFV